MAARNLSLHHTGAPSSPVDGSGVHRGFARGKQQALVAPKGVRSGINHGSTRLFLLLFSSSRTKIPEWRLILSMNMCPSQGPEKRTNTSRIGEEPLDRAHSTPDDLTCLPPLTPSSGNSRGTFMGQRRTCPWSLGIRGHASGHLHLPSGSQSPTSPL